MKALQFNFQWPRLAAAKILGQVTPAGYLSRVGPLGLRDVPEPEQPSPEWVTIAVKHCGVCGSDLKQVFLQGAMDNPMASLLSFPHVLGHEMVGTVTDCGAEVVGVKPGDRVAVYPWLSCVPRGLAPCEACQRGRVTQCQNFTEGRFSAGIHLGTCRDLPGGFSQTVVAHQSMCFAIPEGISFEVAALADPFAVSLHALLKAPPKPGDTVLVTGCGTLGLLLIQLLDALYPDVVVLATDLHEHVEPLAKSCGADHFFLSRGAQLIDAIGEALDIPRQRGLSGLPWMLDGVSAIYDTVGSAGTLEVGIRVAAPGATVVLVGVDEPQRFEWTPLYFKEIKLVGSSGYDVESFEGETIHAFDLFLKLVGEGRVDPSPVITHNFPLSEYRQAFLTAHAKATTHAVKVLVSP